MPQESIPIIFLGRQVDDSDAGLANQLLGLVECVDSAQNGPVLAAAVIQRNESLFCQKTEEAFSRDSFGLSDCRTINGKIFRESKTKAPSAEDSWQFHCLCRGSSSVRSWKELRPSFQAVADFSFLTVKIVVGDLVFFIQ